MYRSSFTPPTTWINPSKDLTERDVVPEEFLFWAFNAKHPFQFKHAFMICCEMWRMPLQEWENKLTYVYKPKIFVTKHIAIT